MTGEGQFGMGQGMLEAGREQMLLRISEEEQSAVQLS